MYRRLAVAIVATLLCIYGWSRISPGSEGPAELVSVTKWNIAEPWFGGFSGMEISADGASVLLVSDRGHFARADLLREDAEITDVVLKDHAGILAPDGQPLRRHQRDTEGLARTATSEAFFVSFEGIHQVWSFDDVLASPVPLAGFGNDVKPRRNGSFEALAIDQAGRLVAITESRFGISGSNPSVPIGTRALAGSFRGAAT
ncbi:esterase-like activity of phytase family protein [uncultured Shimia sp.]|uniref:esterase-like activity of phytase family protein n=1 Tax=uncultured Shimia sp. TaxID=573152 RepID=UPI002622C416|nr:esterase-like activity of phytase family protein [uncultured Shimia sp.]